MQSRWNSFESDELSDIGANAYAVTNAGGVICFLRLTRILLVFVLPNWPAHKNVQSRDFGETLECPQHMSSPYFVPLNLSGDRPSFVAMPSCMHMRTCLLDDRCDVDWALREKLPACRQGVLATGIYEALGAYDRVRCPGFLRRDSYQDIWGVPNRLPVCRRCT